MVVIQPGIGVEYAPSVAAACGSDAYWSEEEADVSDPHVHVTLRTGQLTDGGEREVWGVLDAYVDCWGLIGTLEREGVETVDLELPRVDFYCNESR